MKTNEKKSDFELIMEAIDAIPSNPCAYKRMPTDSEPSKKIVEALKINTKSTKSQYIFNGKILNCKANLAKEIFIKYAQETLCTSEELLCSLRHYNIGKYVVKTEQEVKERNEKRKSKRINIEVREIYPEHNSFEMKDGVRLIVCTEFTDKTLNPVINFAQDKGWNVEMFHNGSSS